jgi:hypothetical protein
MEMAWTLSQSFPAFSNAALASVTEGVVESVRKNIGVNDDVQAIDNRSPLHPLDYADYSFAKFEPL